LRVGISQPWGLRLWCACARLNQIALMPSSSFCLLRATARNRAIAVYAAPPSPVGSLLPDALAPVTREGMAFLSLVGAELTNIQGLGRSVLGLRRAPVVELRVHVRPAQAPASAHGTWTVQAHASRRRLAWGARWLYGEPVAVTSMQPLCRTHPDRREVTYRFDSNGREQRVRVESDGTSAAAPSPEASSSLFLRPSWRFGTNRHGRLWRARVTRSKAALCPVRTHHVTLDAASVYGTAGRLLDSASPAHVYLAPETSVALYRRAWGPPSSPS
jgi:uncharacterized protein YqjF (DUF2071 family)